MTEESSDARLFVAVVPPPEVIDLIADLPTRALRGVRYTKRDQWHVTIKFLGQVETADALHALDQVEASTTQVTLGPAVTLLGTRIVILPAVGLDDLAEATATAFDGVGEPQPPRDFAGHLTLARLKGAPLRDPRLVSVLGAPISATFSAATLTLIKTELKPEGATHTIVAEKALA